MEEEEEGGGRGVKCSEYLLLGISASFYNGTKYLSAEIGDCRDGVLHPTWRAMKILHGSNIDV